MIMKLFTLSCWVPICLARVISPMVASKHAAFFLAGDSTTAVGGGWGNGFITTIAEASFGINYAKGGATTASFRAEGLWDSVLASVEKSTGLGYAPFVTIQFGHNDQKEASGISLEVFTANLERFASQVLDLGGTPILTTSLTRRTFNTTTGKVIENLSDQAEAAISVAERLLVPYIDLNRASTNYINAIGRSLSDTYNLIPSDRTHLNANSELLFGTMVSVLIGGVLRDDERWTIPNVTIADALSKLEYIFPTPLEGTSNSTAPPGW